MDLPSESDAVGAWLVGASRSLEVEALVSELGERLRAAGAPVARLSTSLLTKHPEVLVLNLTWAMGRSVVVVPRPHELLGTTMYAGSPAALLRDGARSVRCRLAGPRSEADRYVLTRSLRDAGMTDYFAQALVFGDGQRTFMSFATDTPGGFEDGHIALFESFAPLLTLRFELACERHATRSLLAVYLGKNAASRVLSGAFRRGTGEVARCAILSSDMRGFTDFADRYQPAVVVATLDRFFEAVAGPVQEEGGEILKFIGDAVLAVFRDGPRAACSHALGAAERALQAIDALNVARAAAGEDQLGLGLSLHFGEVMYGNIGAQDRLDFTVIGATVNEACRVESLCKVVGRPLLMTSAFVAELGTDHAERIESLGAHRLKGVGQPIEVFGLGIASSAQSSR